MKTPLVPCFTHYMLALSDNNQDDVLTRSTDKTNRKLNIYTLTSESDTTPCI